MQIKTFLHKEQTGFICHMIQYCNSKLQTTKICKKVAAKNDMPYSTFSHHNDDFHIEI
jgi:hypothetical protein